MDKLETDDVVALQGQIMVDQDGDRIGKIADIYVDDDTREPEWALVHTGVFGGGGSFVPLAEATRWQDGLQVPYTKDEVREAPAADPDKELSQDQEARLYSHYGLRDSASASTSGLPIEPAPAALRTASGDNVELIRSKERLDVRVERRPAESVRLRKVVVTENVTQTVQVRHEELVVERVPITDGDVVNDDTLGEQHYEIVLHAERPVVTMQTVPVERIRVSTAQVTEKRQVSDVVREERIELAEPPRSAPSTGR